MWVHLLAAVVWVGGMLFVGLVVIPASRQLPGPTGPQMVSLVGRRFRAIGWAMMAVLLLTGVLIAWGHDITPASILDGSALDSHLGRTLVEKTGLFLVMVLLSALHDFVLGPRAVALQRQAVQQPDLVSRARRLRSVTSWLARLNALLALAILGLAVLLFRPL